MIDAIVTALLSLATPTMIVILILGVLLGLLMGTLPGLGGAITLSLLIPITYNLGAEAAILMMVAALSGVNFGGSVTAILINTPGTAPNAATLFDGYPMTKQGRAGEAIAAAAVASAIGAIFGLVLFAVLVPVIRPIILKFWSVEVLWLAVLGLCTIAVAARGSILSDIIAGLLGIMLTFHGLSRVTGATRYTWDSRYLLDGIPLIPAIIGLFAISEAINLYTKRGTIAETTLVEGGRSIGIRQTVKNWRQIAVSSLVGWIIGTIPGVGGTVANFVAYFRAKESSSDPDSFGQGNIVGVIASESSNDAKDGGSMIPTLGLGIPGSASTAVLLSAFLLHGIQPGPIMFDDHLNLVFLIIFAMILGNILTSAIGLTMANTLARVTQVNVIYIVPVIVALALYGSYVLHYRIGDTVVAITIGIVGYQMIRFDISRVAFALGLILGSIIEDNFHRALQYSRGDWSIFYSRPISQGLIVLVVIVVLYPIINKRLRARSA